MSWTWYRSWADSFSRVSLGVGLSVSLGAGLKVALRVALGLALVVRVSAGPRMSVSPRCLP